MTNEIIQENDIDVKIIIKQFIEKHNNCFLKRIENNGSVTKKCAKEF